MRIRLEDSDYDMEVVTKYNYLGMEITNTGEEDGEIQCRISNRNRYAGSM